jgi:hypothetical protein
VSTPIEQPTDAATPDELSYPGPTPSASVRRDLPFLPDVPPLPVGSVLLHIGVHKTGTTALQAALTDARPILRQNGVYYPGKRPAQHRSALAVLQRPWGWVDRGAEAYDRSVFDWLAQRTREYDGTVVISSEFFCEANAESAAEVVKQLGGDNVHVVVTLRNLGAILPSSWQQYLKYGMATGYFKWLRDVFENPGGSSMTPSFWLRQDHKAVVERWLEAVPPERMIVAVLDDVDRRSIFRTFEQLLALPDQTLQSRMNLTSNRSMTAVECQLLLDLNRNIAMDIEWAAYQRFVRRGLALRMVEEREPPADEPRLYTPRWALEAASGMGADAARFLSHSGVRVLGDPAALSAVAATGTKTQVDERRVIPSDVAVAALKAVIEVASEPASDEVVSTKALVGELWSRIKTDGKARWSNRSLRSR